MELSGHSNKVVLGPTPFEYDGSPWKADELIPRERADPVRLEGPARQPVHRLHSHRVGGVVEGRAQPVHQPITAQRVAAPHHPALAPQVVIRGIPGKSVMLLTDYGRCYFFITQTEKCVYTEIKGTRLKSFFLCFSRNSKESANLNCDTIP